MMETTIDPFRNVDIPDYEHWSDARRLQWIHHWAHIYLNSTTREERIAHYRAKQGENVKYYDTYGWPEQF
jgi:hypothetical protein